MRQVAIRPNTIGSFTINLSTLIDRKVHDNGIGITNEDIFDLADDVQDKFIQKIGFPWMTRLMSSMPLSRFWSRENDMPTRMSRIMLTVTMCLITPMQPN